MPRRGTRGPSAYEDVDFQPRWCSGPATDQPCLESATRNGSPVLATDPDYDVQSTGLLNMGFTDYIQWMVVTKDFTRLATSDTWSVTFDMGTTKPRYTEGFGGRTVVERTSDGDGTYHVTMTGKPVFMAESCGDDYPPVCENPTPYDSTSVKFYGEVWDLDADDEPGDASWRNGYDRWQNLDGVNDPFFEPTPDGGYVLTVDTYNAATYDDDESAGTPGIAFAGQFKLRLPYQLMRKRFLVPDPDTLPVTSLAGGTTGSGIDGTWVITKDTSEHVFYASVTGIRYPDTVAARAFARATSQTQVRTLRVKRGVIVPYAPRSVTAVRTTASRGRLSYAAARARGARPTGYSVRCVNLAGTHVVTASDTASPTVVTGLRSGKAYDCRVRAKSKAGWGVWSPKVRLAPRP